MVLLLLGLRAQALLLQVPPLLVPPVRQGQRQVVQLQCRPEMKCPGRLRLLLQVLLLLALLRVLALRPSLLLLPVLLLLAACLVG